jgi:hypothetical protein
MTSDRVFQPAPLMSIFQSGGIMTTPILMQKKRETLAHVLLQDA